MNRTEIQAALDDAFDQALVFHGYADHLRDYDVYVLATADPSTGIPPAHLRYRFTHCVAASVTIALSPEVLADSLDDRLTDHDAASAPDLSGYVWGVRWQELYPGMSIAAESPDADGWSERLGLPFHEVRIRANCHDITLVFSDLVVSAVRPGHAPFVVSE